MSEVVRENGDWKMSRLWAMFFFLKTVSFANLSQSIYDFSICILDLNKYIPYNFNFNYMYSYKVLVSSIKL